MSGLFLLFRLEFLSFIPDTSTAAAVFALDM